MPAPRMITRNAIVNMKASRIMPGLINGGLFARSVPPETRAPQSRGLPVHLESRHWARPYDVCAVCLESKPHIVSHHDHFRDLVVSIACDKNLLLDSDPATFPNVTLCNDCNHLCVRFKTARKNAAAFMSLSPDDMQLYLGGIDTHELLDRVQDRYREPFGMWAAKLNAWPEFRAAYQSGRDQRKPVSRVKPERQKVLNTLDARPDLKLAFDQQNIRECLSLGHSLVAAGEWNDRVLHSFAAQIWYLEHGGPQNTSRFFSAFAKGNTPEAIRAFKRGLDTDW